MFMWRKIKFWIIWYIILYDLVTIKGDIKAESWNKIFSIILTGLWLGQFSHFILPGTSSNTIKVVKANIGMSLYVNNLQIKDDSRPAPRFFHFC